MGGSFLLSPVPCWREVHGEEGLAETTLTWLHCSDLLSPLEGNVTKITEKRGLPYIKPASTLTSLWFPLLTVKTGEEGGPLERDRRAMGRFKSLQRSFYPLFTPVSPLTPSPQKFSCL